MVLGIATLAVLGAVAGPVFAPGPRREPPRQRSLPHGAVGSNHGARARKCSTRNAAPEAAHNCCLKVAETTVVYIFLFNLFGLSRPPDHDRRRHHSLVYAISSFQYQVA